MDNSCISVMAERLNGKMKNQEHDWFSSTLQESSWLTTPQNHALRQFHIKVAIKLEERAGELVFAPGQYTSAFYLPLFNPKKLKVVLKLAPYPPDLAVSDYFFLPN